MREVVLFCEDSFHEKFVGQLLQRFAAEYNVDVATKILSAQGGLPRMQSEFTQFIKDLSRQKTSLPDAIIVVADANCLGYGERKAQMGKALLHHDQFERIVTYAIPDPHIERWMLVDPVAFQNVFGRGCTLPAIKCAKNEYKKLLRHEIRQTGIDPPLGGEEYAEDIVAQMNLAQAEAHEPSLGLFLRSLKAQFNSWSAR